MLRFQRTKIQEHSKLSPMSTRESGNSVLDPHNSVMQLLQATEEETGVAIQDTSLSESLGESWQPVSSIDITEEDNGEISRHVTNNSTSILSSSDTSEEEEATQEREPYKNFHMTTNEGYMMNSDDKNGAEGEKLLNQADDSTSRSATENGAEKGGELSNPVSLYEDIELSGTGSVARSTGSSSTSFVMPKLSLTYKTSQLKTLLVIGRPGRLFYDKIPESYKEIFELPMTTSPHEFNNHLGIVIVFQEMKELIALLNRVIQYTDKMPIIPICESEQRTKVKNILKTFLKNQMIVLMYPPVTISNDYDMGKMFQYTKKLVAKIKRKEVTGCEEIAFANNTGGGYDSLEKRTKYKKNPKKRRKYRKPPNYPYGKWLTWGISLTIGVSLGYCATYIITTTLFYSVPNDTPQIKSAGSHKGFSVITSGSSAKPPISHSHDYGNESHHQGFIKHTISIIKKTFLKINGTMGTVIASITQIIKQNTIPDDQVFALGYMLT
ncbi:Autophagy-related protein 32 [Nakaseomyces bracarensis]|uniref:Autophagy-related protein 32 n=1 Tax=Nakaseomyces bracarensis TaxID=273131 RepID=A0ABR4NN55_9SACH